jgi:hypothetical protein
VSSIHYFQRYSQPENVATNNTLLLFSRLYQLAPVKFKGFINDLLDDINFEAGINFNQQNKIVNKQSKNSSTIPDGTINQSSFKVVIETKLHKNFSIEQLRGHLKDFREEDNQVLLSLSPKKPDAKLKDIISSEVQNYNQLNSRRIKFISTTFKEIVEKFKGILNDYEFELINMIDDYEGYCIQDNLIINDEDRMRVVTCGWTIKENFKYNLYYDPVERGYSDHAYLGIYTDKSVRGFGEIENIITADLLPNDQLRIINSIMPVTKNQEVNIKEMMATAKAKNNWNIEKGHKFFCVKEFFKTDFKKETKYPLQGTKLFSLKNVLGIDKLPETEIIADLLKEKKW